MHDHLDRLEAVAEKVAHALHHLDRREARLQVPDAFQFDAPARNGFDGLVEFPPHGLTPPRIERRLTWLNSHHSGAVFDYAATAEEAARRLQRRRGQAHDLFPGVMPDWDNEARRPGAGNIFHGATPQAYARWLAAACEAAERTLPADRRLVFVNAWNEWAEGAYLEPDRRWGRAFLQATAAVMGAPQGDERAHK
jgi:lipopolysaccharide biosynthesis protein